MADPAESAPWEDYAAPEAAQDSGPWSDYEPSKPGVWSELKRSYVQAALEGERQIGVALAKVLPESTQLGRLARETQGRVAAIAPQYERPQEVTDMPWYTPTRIAGGVGQGAASMAPGLAIGGLAAATGLGAVPAAIVGGAVAGYQEAESFYRQRLGEGIPEPQAYKEALEAFPIIGALNVLPFHRILGRVPGRLVTGGLEAVTEIAEEPVQAVIAGKDPWAATVTGAKEVGPAAAILGFAGGGGGLTTGKPTTAVDKAKFQTTITEQEAGPWQDYAPETAPAPEPTLAQGEAGPWQDYQQVAPETAPVAEAPPGPITAAAPEPALAEGESGPWQDYAEPAPVQAPPAAAIGSAQAGRPINAPEPIAQPASAAEAPRAAALESFDRRVSERTSQWGTNAPALTVADGNEQVPAGVLRQVGDRALGWYDTANGRVGLNRANIVAEAESRGVPVETVVDEAIVHESVGHHGMIKMLGPRWGWVKGQVGSLSKSDPVLGKIAEGVAVDYADTGADVQAAETVARFAEQQPNHPMVQRLLAWMRELVRTRFKINVDLSVNDLIAMLHRAARYNEGGEATPTSGVLASRTGTPTFVTERNDERVTVKETSQGYEVVMPNGQSLGVFANAGEAARVAQREQQGAGVFAARRPTSDVGHKREITSGRYVGAPDWVGSDPRQLVKLRKTLRSLANEGKIGRWWYEKSARAVLRFTGGDKTLAEKFIGLLAIYSQGTSVPANTTGAIKAWYQWRAGLPITAGRFPVTQGRKAEAWLNRGEDWGGIKTNNFYTDLMEEIDPSKVDLDHSTMDMWMALAFDHGTKVLDQGPKYAFAQREIAAIAKQMGWRPHQVQAAIWTSIKARVEGSAKERNAYEDANGIRVLDEKGNHQIAKGREYDHFRTAHRFGMESGISQAEIDATDFDFSSALGQRAATTSWEATPGVTSGVLPGIHSASTARVKEYLTAIRRALTENGRDLIDARLGLLTNTGLEGPSGWKGKTTASVQQQAGVSVDDGAVSGPSRVLVNLAADIRGLILNQEAVAWHFPIYNGGKFGQNGVEFKLGRTLTEAETEGLYQSIIKELEAVRAATLETATKRGPSQELGRAPTHQNSPPIPTETGFRVLNFQDEKFALMGETDPAIIKKLQGVLRKQNTEFHAAVERAVHAQPWHGEMKGAERFETDGELRENDWGKGDEDYRSRIAEAYRGLQEQGHGGRPELADLQKWIDDELRPRIEAVNREFAKKYGWDQSTEGEVTPTVLASRPEGMGRQGSVTTGTSAPVPAPSPPKVEAGGGTYTTAPFSGISPQAQSLILQVMSAEDVNIAEQRGNAGQPITWSDTGKEAQALLDSKFGATFNSLVNRLPRSAANTAMMESYARLVNTAGEDVRRAVEQYSRTNSAQDLAALTASREQLGVVLAPFMGYRTEAGRALNILKKVQADFADANAIFDALGDGHEDAMKEFARRVKKTGSVAEVLELTKASYKPTAFDQYREFWINSILSGPWTHAVNITSNAAYSALELGTELTTSLFSKHVSTKAALARAQGMMLGTTHGASLAGRAFMTDEPQFTQQTQIEGKRHAIPGVAGSIIRTPGRALMAEDEFFKVVNFTGELYRLAAEEAEQTGKPIGEVLKGYANNRKVQAQARAWAQRMTFQDKLGLTGQKVMQLRDHIWGAWILAPFIRTPTNIMKRALEYTPAALASPRVRETLKEGGRDAALAKGRMLLGGAAMAGVAGLVAQGLLTGSGPGDPKEKALWLRTGKQPYSVKIGDTWYQYNRLDPVGMMIGVAADMSELGKTVERGEYDQVANQLLASVFLNLANKTYLRGITDFVEFYNDPKRYGAQWISGMAASNVPNIAAQTARAMDPFARDARGVVDSIKARIPGVRESLPQKLDVAGEPIKTSLVEPLRASKERDDPLAETLLRLGIERGSPGRTIKWKGREVKLSGEEYASMSGFVQQERWRILTPIVTSDAFKARLESNELAAQAFLENAYTKVGTRARLKWLSQNREVLDKVRNAPRAPVRPSAYSENSQQR